MMKDNFARWKKFFDSFFNASLIILNFSRHNAPRKKKNNKTFSFLTSYVFRKNQTLKYAIREF